MVFGDNVSKIEAEFVRLEERVRNGGTAKDAKLSVKLMDRAQKIGTEDALVLLRRINTFRTEHGLVGMM